jgi:mono/diheme cytochrome c family protein
MLRRMSAFALLAVAACGDKVDRVLARDGDPVAGARVWDTHCRECHAPDGSGTETGPDLTDDHDTADRLAEKILYGWGEMPGFEDELTIREVADLIAFVERDVWLR